MKIQKLLEEAKPDFSKSGEDNIWITKGYILRRWIGFLGILLPILLYVQLFFLDGLYLPLESISHYYFTRASSTFVIVLSLLAIFLIIYKGKEWKDFVLSLVAGIAALCVISFPTNNLVDVVCNHESGCVVTVLNDNISRERAHLFFAGGFLICLAIMSLSVFTKSHGPGIAKTQRKINRNKVYIASGIVMFACIGVIALGQFGVIPTGIYQKWRMTFCMETLAIWVFGISWLVKGDTFACLNDKDENHA